MWWHCKTKYSTNLEAILGNNMSLIWPFTRKPQIVEYIENLKPTQNIVHTLYISCMIELSRSKLQNWQTNSTRIHNYPNPETKQNSKEEVIAKWDSKIDRNVISKLCLQIHILVVAVQPCPKTFTNVKFCHNSHDQYSIAICMQIQFAPNKENASRGTKSLHTLITKQYNRSVVVAAEVHTMNRSSKQNKNIESNEFYQTQIWACGAIHKCCVGCKTPVCAHCTHSLPSSNAKLRPCRSVTKRFPNGAMRHLSSSSGRCSHQHLLKRIRYFWKQKTTNSSSSVYTGGTSKRNSSWAKIRAPHSTMPSTKSRHELHVPLTFCNVVNVAGGSRCGSSYACITMRSCQNEEFALKPLWILIPKNGASKIACRASKAHMHPKP